MVVYQIINIVNGMRYIGITTRPLKYRQRDHKYALKGGRHGNRYLQSAYNKYGLKCFKFEIIKECSSLEELNVLEAELIKKSDNLYNLQSGGNAFNHSPTAKLAIGEANKIPIVGMNVDTKEIVFYDSAADAKKDGFNEKNVRKCCTLFESTRKNGPTFKSISHKGWVFMNRSEYTEDKLLTRVGLARRGKIRLERAVVGMNVFTKQLIRFKSAADAGRNGFNGAVVGKLCNKLSAVHKGFVWVYNDVANQELLLEEKRKHVLSKTRTGPKSWQF